MVKSLDTNARGARMNGVHPASLWAGLRSGGRDGAHGSFRHAGGAIRRRSVTLRPARLAPHSCRPGDHARDRDRSSSNAAAPPGAKKAGGRGVPGLGDVDQPISARGPVLIGEQGDVVDDMSRYSTRTTRPSRDKRGFSTSVWRGCRYECFTTCPTVWDDRGRPPSRRAATAAGSIPDQPG